MDREIGFTQSRKVRKGCKAKKDFAFAVLRAFETLPEGAVVGRPFGARLPES